MEKLEEKNVTKCNDWRDQMRTHRQRSEVAEEERSIDGKIETKKKC